MIAWRAISAMNSACAVLSRSVCLTTSGASCACLNWASVMNLSSCMRRSTYISRLRARFGLTTGLYAEGALGRPASMAASATSTCASGLP